MTSRACPPSTVSVVIPFYQGRRWLDEALHSALHQTHPVQEIVVVCDGPTEDTSRLGDIDPRIRVVTTLNRGPGAARNLGIELTTGKYVAFLDSDDLWMPNKIEAQVAMMEESQVVWSHTSYETFDDGAPTRQPRAVHSGRRHNGSIYPKLLSSCSIATPTVMVRADALRGNPTLRFSEQMRFGQDMYLWSRLAAAFDVLGIDSVLARVRMRGTNAALRAEVQLGVRAAMWNEIKSDPGALPAERISTSTRVAFAMSQAADQILQSRPLAARSRRPREALARGLYAIPHLIFKFDSVSNAAPRKT